MLQPSRSLGTVKEDIPDVEGGTMEHRVLDADATTCSKHSGHHLRPFFGETSNHKVTKSRLVGFSVVS